MPIINPRKTYLEKTDPTPVMSILRFLHSGRYSPLVRAIRYAVIGVCGDVAADVKARDAVSLSAQVTDESLVDLEWTRAYIRDRLAGQGVSRRLLPYLSGYADEGIPFSDFQDEPAPVSQIKKIINALYHTEEALKIAESIDIEGLSLEEGNSMPETLSKLWGPFVEHIYQLCMLTTHPDLDLSIEFGDEWRQINRIISMLVISIPQKYLEQRDVLSRDYGLKFDSKEAIAKQFGSWSGAALQGLKPTRTLNYSTVSNFGADVSRYLNGFTKFLQDSSNRYFTAPYLNQGGARVEQYEISQERMRDLETASIKLEEAFKSLMSKNGILQYLNAVALVNVVSSIVTLSTSVIDESGHFRAETEELIRASFAQLKFVMSGFVISIDKFEEEMMIRPGEISEPWVKTLDEYYDFLFSYVDGFVDLSKRGQNLPCLVDSTFIESRQYALYERQALREKNLMIRQSQEKIVDEFFVLLAQHQGRRLNSLIQEDKDKLLDLFAVIQPLIAEQDVVLSNTIAEALLPPEPQSQSQSEEPPATDTSTSLGGKIWDGLAYVGARAYEVGSSAYQAWDPESVLPRRYLGEYEDLIELLDEGYTFELLGTYTLGSTTLSPAEYMPGVTFFSNRIYVKVIDGKIALCIKQLNGTFFSDIITPLDAPSSGTLSLEQLKPLEQEILSFARAQGLIRPSLHQRIKQRIKKEQATCLFRAQINADCRAKIYESSGELLQQLYPQHQDAYRVLEMKLLQREDEPAMSIVELSDIALDDLLHLYQAYSVASSQLTDAQSSFIKFFECLEHEPPGTVLSSLSDNDELRHLYTEIQPYLISSLRALKGNQFTDNFDERFIKALSGRTTQGKTFPVEDILNIRNVVLHDFRQKQGFLIKRKEEIKRTADLKVCAHRSETLRVDNPHGVRTHFVIKDPKYTQYMKKISVQLDHFSRTFFSNEIQKKLVVQTQSLFDQSISMFIKFESRPEPFPEANASNTLEYLKQERQVLWLKQFYNCVHHLREVAIQCEQLSEESAKVLYVWRSVMIEEHLRCAVMLYQQISKDEFLAPLTTELRESLSVMIESVKIMSLPYAPEKSDKDAYLDEVHDVVFYITNGLCIGHEQIDAWQKGEYLTATQAERAQVFSEEISSKVRRIVDENSYLKWALQAGTFYTLFYDLKDCWNQFSASSTNAIEANIESIYTQNFTHILIQADAWERKAGIATGSISGPLKDIFDAYYTGMVEVLSHDTWHQISLLTTELPYTLRQEALAVALAEARSDIDHAQNKLSVIRAFKASLTNSFGTPPLLWQDPKAVGDESYQEFLTLLEALSSVPSVSLCMKELIQPELLAVIQLQKAPLPEEIPACQDALKKLVDICEAHFEGDSNTARLSLEHCYAQRDQWRDALAQQKIKNKEIKKQTIKKLVWHKLGDYQSGGKRLVSVKKIYDQALQEEVEKHLDDFLVNISERTSLENQVDDFLNEIISAFEAVYLKEFQQLNELHSALSDLNSYLASQQSALGRVRSFYQHTWANENQKTLDDKRLLYQSLACILKGKKTYADYRASTLRKPVPDEFEEGEKVFDPEDRWHIKARISRFKNAIEDPDFGSILLKSADNLSPLSWLVGWFTRVLGLLGIYKTEAQVMKQHFHAVAQEATSTVTILSSLTQKNNDAAGQVLESRSGGVGRPQQSMSLVSLFKSKEPDAALEHGKKTPGPDQTS